MQYCTLHKVSPHHRKKEALSSDAIILIDGQQLEHRLIHLTVGLSQVLAVFGIRHIFGLSHISLYTVLRALEDGGPRRRAVSSYPASRSDR